LPDLTRGRGRANRDDTPITYFDDIDDWIRNTVITVNHPLGICAMGRGSDAVVDPDLRVRGVEALRVVDAAALPDMPSAHINAIVMMLAERASDLIPGVRRVDPPALRARRHAGIRRYPRLSLLRQGKVVDAGIRRHDEGGVAEEAIIRTPGIIRDRPRLASANV
jgi:hypothetical protein